MLVVYLSLSRLPIVLWRDLSPLWLFFFFLNTGLDVHWSCFCSSNIWVVMLMKLWMLLLIYLVYNLRKYSLTFWLLQSFCLLFYNVPRVLGERLDSSVLKFIWLLFSIHRCLSVAKRSYLEEEWSLHISVDLRTNVCICFVEAMLV